MIQTFVMQVFVWSTFAALCLLFVELLGIRINWKMLKSYIMIKRVMILLSMVDWLQKHPKIDSVLDVVVTILIRFTFTFAVVYVTYTNLVYYTTMIDGYVLLISAIIAIASEMIMAIIFSKWSKRK